MQIIDRRNYLFSLIMLLAFIFFSCENGFVSDGDPTKGINPNGGYFYQIDNDSFQLIMLDANMNTLKQWDFSSISNFQDVRGIALDGQNIWLSVASKMDKIFKVNTSMDSLIILKSFDAPPTKKGVIRGLAWDGSSLWAVNSGSTTQSISPKLYKLNSDDGAIIEEYNLPSAEPRPLTYVGTNADVYGRSIESGLYYADIKEDKVFKFDNSKKLFSEVFPVPEPPRGKYYIFTSGLTFDEDTFWLVNSSSVGNHLFSLDKKGMIKQRIEFPYSKPGVLVWGENDIRATNSPTILSVNPNTGSPGETIQVQISGTGFLPGTEPNVSFGEGITVSDVLYIDYLNISATIKIANNATAGKRNIVYTSSGETTTGDSLFTVSKTNPNNGFIWVTDFNDGSITKIAISDSTIVKKWFISSFSNSKSAQGLAYDGTNIWVSVSGTEDKIFKLDTSGDNLIALSTITAPPTSAGTIREITFDTNGNLWAANSATNRLYKLDKISGIILDTLITPGNEARGIVFAEGNLYCNDRTIDSLFAYNSNTQSWLSKFETPTPPNGTTSNRYGTGMAWDGINFWMANSTGEFDYIFQISETGQVLKTIDMPNRGSAQPGGLIFTTD